MINYLIGGIVIAAVILAIRSIRKNRKNGGCAGGCSGCPQGSKCHSFETSQENPLEKRNQ